MTRRHGGAGLLYHRRRNRRGGFANRFVLVARLGAVVHPLGCDLGRARRLDLAGAALSCGFDLGFGNLGAGLGRRFGARPDRLTSGLVCVASLAAIITTGCNRRRNRESERAKRQPH